VVRPSNKERALALTYKSATGGGALLDDAVLFENGKWRYESQPAAAAARARSRRCSPATSGSPSSARARGGSAR
jgi:hypothetical protein